MSLLQFLQLQPIDSQDDPALDDAVQLTQDDTIDLSSDIDEETLDKNWERIITDMHQEERPPSARARRS